MFGFEDECVNVLGREYVCQCSRRGAVGNTEEDLEIVMIERFQRR